MDLHRLADILSLSKVKVFHSPTVDVPPLSSTVFRSFQHAILDTMGEMKLGLDDTLRDCVERSILQSLEILSIDYEDAVLLAQNVCG